MAAKYFTLFVLTALHIGSSALATVNFDYKGIFTDNTTGLAYEQYHVILPGQASADASSASVQDPPLVQHYPRNEKLPAKSHWAALGWTDCEYWQEPLNIWGCHVWYSIRTWQVKMLEYGHEPRVVLRDMLKKVFQSPDGKRANQYPRSLCFCRPVTFAPAGTLCDSWNGELCVSWSADFTGIISDRVLERVIDKAFSCSAQDRSTMVVARTVDGQNRVICISDKPHDCMNRICNVKVPEKYQKGEVKTL